MEQVYELDKPLKAIVFNHTEYDNEKLTPRTGKAGQQLVDCFQDDLQINDIDHKFNLTKLQVVNYLMESNYMSIINSIKMTHINITCFSINSR